MLRRPRLVASVAAVAVALILNSCGGDSGTAPPPPPPTPTSVTVTPATGSIASLGGTLQLTAQLLSAQGGMIAGGTFAWSSSDVSIATVSATGLVTAVQNGAATITVTSSGFSAGAQITVQQVEAIVAVTPASETVFATATVQLAATVSDANGNAMAAATVTWASSDGTVATVDATGLVTTVAEGAATITATSGPASGTAALTVLRTPDPFAPTADQNLGGMVLASTVNIPAGVTVAATSDLMIMATESVTIAGTITGDCVTIVVDGAASVTVTGTVSNECSGAVGAEIPGLTILADGELALIDATVLSTGELTVGNDREVLVLTVVDGQSASRKSWPAGTTARRSAASAGEDCTFTRSSVESKTADGKNGVDGVEMGTDGRDGGNIVITCRGNVTLDATFFQAGRGGNGGSANNPAGSAVGGKGGPGGDVSLRTTGDVTILTSGDVLSGGGGLGGRATSGGRVAQATGGRGGDAGKPFVIARSYKGSFTAIFRFASGIAGAGGNATATGTDGAAATSTTPAENGGSATAIGGRGGDTGSGQEFFTTNLVGQQSGPTIDLVDMGALSDAGNGGGADATGGKGGDGSRDHTAGGMGGAMTATGGDGGNSEWIFAANPRGLPGNGGAVEFRGGVGGKGDDGCSLTPFGAGGAGGRGGNAMGASGQAGIGGTSPGGNGSTTFQNAGNGGAGGRGAGPGAGGTAGNDGVTIRGLVNRNGTNFTAGATGEPCASSIPENAAFVATDGGGLFVVDLTTKAILQQVAVSTPTDLPRGIARSSDGSVVWIVTEDGVVKSFDSTTRQEIVSTTQPAGLKDVAIHPTTGDVWVVNGTAHTVSALNPETGAIDGNAVTVVNAHQILFTPDGTKAFVRTPTRVIMIDPATRAVIGDPIITLGASHMAMTPDGSKLYVLHSSVTAAEVTVIDVASMMAMKSIPLGGSPPTGGLAVTEDGSKVYVNPGLLSNIRVITTSDDVLDPTPIPAPALTDRLGFDKTGLAFVSWGLTTMHMSDLAGVAIGAPLDITYVILAMILF